MYFLVYKITNSLDGKFYIGCHKTQNKNDGYMGSGKYLKHAIKKYGLENFSKEILFECISEEEMFEKEKQFVILNENSYNLRPGGEGGWQYVNSEKLNNKNKQCVSGGKIGGKSCYEKKVGIHAPDFIRPPQKKFVSDEEMIAAYNFEKNISRALIKLGLARTGGSRRRMEKLLAR